MPLATVEVFATMTAVVGVSILGSGSPALDTPATMTAAVVGFTVRGDGYDDANTQFAEMTEANIRIIGPREAYATNKDQE